MAVSDKPAPHPLFKLATELGPLVIFFGANAKFGLFVATGAFMVAIVAAIAASYIVTKHVPLMAIVTAVIVLVFGGLTLYFHNKDFIQIKPTVIYAMLSAILVFGLVTGRPLLSLFLEAAYPGLTETGWRKLTINWAIFFAFLAVLNEVVRHEFSYTFWLGFKLWGVIPLTLIFAFANVPMLMKHGFSVNSEPPIPPQE